MYTGRSLVRTVVANALASLHDLILVCPASLTLVRGRNVQGFMVVDII